MSAAAGRFGALGRWRRMAIAGLAAMFFASACDQVGDGMGDGADLTAAPTSAVQASSGETRARSTFRPLGSPRPAATSGCTRPADYWQGHPAAWWHRELQMGATTYSKEEQLGILEAAGDNGLVRMGRQLIAARLNIAAGAPAAGLETAFEQADSLIGAHVIPPRGDGWRPAADTATVVDVLAAFNEGRTGPGACR